MFVRDPIMLAVVVEARGLRDAEATIVLEQRINEGEWEAVGNQRVVLGEDGILKRTTFRITPKVVGQYEFRAKVEDAGPELTQEDNVATAAVKVVRQQIRVLLIAGSPSPEVQFLRNALMRDQRVEFAAWLQHADPGFRQPGDRPISRLPNDSAELRNYDALLLVDPDLRALGPQWPEMITHFVGQEGGGVIFVAGELYSQQLFEAADRKTAGGNWTRILPIVRDPGLFRTEAEVRLSSQSTYALELSPEGRGDPVFEFNADPIRNRSILTSLPGMYWSFPVTRSRPGATVLARHGDPRMQNQYGRQPLLTSQLYGPGRTVFIGFDSTYRWRYLSEDYFDGFWARLVDRVGRNKALGRPIPVLRSIWGRASTGSATRSRWASVTPTRRRWPRQRSWPPSSKSPAGRPSRFASRKRPTTPVCLTASFPAGAGRAPIRSGSCRRPRRRPARTSALRPPRSASSPPSARSTNRRSIARCSPSWPGSPAAGSSRSRT